MDQIVATTSSPDYQFGDLTKAAAQEVVEWGRRERKAFESLTGKEYEFGKAFPNEYEFGEAFPKGVRVW